MELVPVRMAVQAWLAGPVGPGFHDPDRRRRVKDSIYRLPTGATAKVIVTKSLLHSRPGSFTRRRCVPNRSHRPCFGSGTDARPDASVVTNASVDPPSRLAPTGKRASGAPLRNTRIGRLSPADSAVGSLSGTISKSSPAGDFQFVSCPDCPTCTKLVAFLV